MNKIRISECGLGNESEVSSYEFQVSSYIKFGVTYNFSSL